jgi:hypothetical protein
MLKFIVVILTLNIGNIFLYVIRFMYYLYRRFVKKDDFEDIFAEEDMNRHVQIGFILLNGSAVAVLFCYIVSNCLLKILS